MQLAIFERTFKNKLYKFFNQIAESKHFQTFVSLAIVGNMLVLASNKYPISENEFKLLELINQIFSAIFFFEMFIKIFGLGLYGYF